MSTIGFTTSIPFEVLLAAGKKPVDLNNQFILRPDAPALVQKAEKSGFPATCCAWMKGIYAVMAFLELEEVIAVVRGDCSQTQGLMEILQMEGMQVYPFAYPYDRSLSAMREEIKKLEKHFGVHEDDVNQVKWELDRIREKLNRLDLLTWQENRVTGKENHSFLVAGSDMKGDPAAFEKEVDSFLVEAEKRVPSKDHETIRLGVLGVPPIWSDFYDKAEKRGVRIVFNEIQRQFSMPYLAEDIAQQYLLFTYPYDIFFRLRDIEKEMTRRRLDGFIHYAQSFCFRQMEDKILRHYLPLPILTLEGDRPESLDGRSQIRLEAFLEMLSQKVLRNDRN